MSHAVSDDQIQRLAVGKLTTHDSLRVQRHTSWCPDCLRRLIEVTLIQEERGEGPKAFYANTTRKPCISFTTPPMVSFTRKLRSVAGSGSGGIGEMSLTDSGMQNRS